MQQVRSNREPLNESNGREGVVGESPSVVHSDLSSLFNDYTYSQRHYSDRLESLEREMASLKGQVAQSFVSTATEHEPSRSLTNKKPAGSPPTSPRIMSSTRLPLQINTRKVSNDEVSIISTNDGPFSRSLPQVLVGRSKSFHNGALHPSPSPLTNSSEEASFLRSYKAHIEQVLRKDAPPFSDIKVPNYASIDDVMKANENLLLENDRLRSELNRLKTESILLLRSMRTTTTTGLESNFGNERITAERERQELAIELARQVEENKRLRRSLLSQSAKFVILRQSTSLNDAALSTSNDQRFTPESAPQPTLSFNRTQQPSKSTRLILGNRGVIRPRTFNHGSHDPL